MKITNEIREAFPMPHEVRMAVDAATANLMHGPGHGSFSKETLGTIREWIDSLPSPVYFNKSSGEIETNPEECVMPWLVEITDQSVIEALIGSELIPYVR